MKKPAKKASPKAASVRVKAAPGVATPGTGGRRASVSRATKETRISAAINLDGTGKYDIQTGIGFLDHMLEQLSRHSLIDITVRAEGDLHIDYHHTTEDTGIVLGECLQKALGDRGGIRRYGSAVIPMDETLTEVALDASNRPYLIWKVEFSKPKLGSMDTELFKEWFQAFAMNAGITLHVETLYGINDHHISESCFKGLARALGAAIAAAREGMDIRIVCGGVQNLADMVWVTLPDSPLKSGRDLVARLKADAGAISTAISGVIGNHNYIALAQLARAAGGDVRKLKVVTYNGGGDGITIANAAVLVSLEDGK